MPKFDDQPTVKWWREQSAASDRTVKKMPLNVDALRQLCLEAGADDVGFVELDRAAIADQYADIVETFPSTKTLLSFVCRMNRENVRAPARSIANLEFHAANDDTKLQNDSRHRHLAALSGKGTKSSLGAAATQDSHQWFTKTPPSLWQIFSCLKSFASAAVDKSMLSVFR